MYLAHLKLQNFRTYPKLEVDFTDQATVLVGPNATGKTNLLEAIRFLSLFKSFRTSSVREVVCWGERSCQIEGEIIEANAKQNLKASLVANRAAGTIKRIVRHNGANIPARSGVGLFPTVLFAPEDLLLVASSPGRRRKYLDTVLGQISPRYYSALQRYNQALEQRNALLLTATSLTPTEIEVWEEQLAGEGARLIRGRSAFLEAINNALERIYQQLSNDHKKLYLRYVPALNLPGLESLVTEGQLIRLLRQALKQSRSFDMTIKQTSLGPQRDDFIFELDGRPLVEAGSRGEWRSAVLALKIREKQYLENLIKQPAVLLFDDVFSELDPYRRRLLAEQIRGAQCFVTTTELRALGQPFLNAAQVWRVTPGAVTKW